jgi:hypothetical protein
VTKPSDLILHSLEQKPIEFGDSFNTLIKDRLEAAIENKKMELAKTLFNYHDEDEPEENDDEFGHSDIEGEEDNEVEQESDSEVETEDNEDA